MRDCKHGQLAQACPFCEMERGIERLRAEIAEAKRDVDRINWMEKNKVGIYAAQSSVRATTGPRYFKPWKFCGWSAANRDDELPTVRVAIDAAMAGGGHG